MGRLDGKIALVTGASRGIGRAIALELAREGSKVALNYQSSDARAQEVADEIARLGGACLIAKADVADPHEARAMVKRVIDHYGRLDILVNNAGITRAFATQEFKRALRPVISIEEFNAGPRQRVHDFGLISDLQVQGAEYGIAPK